MIVDEERRFEADAEEELVDDGSELLDRLESRCRDLREESRAEGEARRMPGVLDAKLVDCDNCNWALRLEEEEGAEDQEPASLCEEEEALDASVLTGGPLEPPKFMGFSTPPERATEEADEADVGSEMRPSFKHVI